MDAPLEQMIIRVLSKGYHREWVGMSEIWWKPVYLYKRRHESRWYKMNVKWCQGWNFLGLVQWEIP